MDNCKNNTNLRYVVLIRSGINIQKNLLALYDTNKGFIVHIAKQFDIPNHRYDDCMQLAYLALIDAVANYKFIYNSSFINYYQKWLKHYFYKDFVKMSYPMCLNSHNIKNIDQLKFYSLEELFVEQSGESLQYTSLTDSINVFDILEDDIINAIWNIVHDSLSEINYYVIVQRFKHNRTLESIAKSLGIGKERVRLRILRSLKKLRFNDDLRQIAIDWYAIRV